MRFLLFVILSTVRTYAYQELQPLLLTAKEHTAGKASTVSYAIEIPNGSVLRLLELHSLGFNSTQANVNECQVSFPTGPSLWNNTGEVRLKLFSKDHLLSEEIVRISPDTSYAPIVEAYCGPKQILTGGKDFTMAIGTGLDSLDNPWPQGTVIDYKYLYKNTYKERAVEMKTLHSYTHFFSDNQSGTPVITVSAKGSSHNEFNITLYPNQPRPFELNSDRAHDFADGKQISTISTSAIKDRYGNLIADGTLVYFQIINSLGGTTFANAGLVNGTASIHLPAPKQAMSWSIRAYIEDYTRSNTITIQYKPSVEPFPVATKDGTLNIGPIKGFSNQFVPDHTEVNINLCSEDKYYEVTLYTENGECLLLPEKLNLPSGKYDVMLDCGGQIVYEQMIVL